MVSVFPEEYKKFLINTLVSKAFSHVTTTDLELEELVNNGYSQDFINAFIRNEMNSTFDRQPNLQQPFVGIITNLLRTPAIKSEKKYHPP